MRHALILCLFCASLVQARLTVKYDRKAELAKEAILSWSFNNDTKMFSFGLEITAAVLGTSDAVWAGIGIGEQTSGSMLGADIVTAQFDRSVLNVCSKKNRHVPFAPFPIGDGINRVFPAENRCQSDVSWKLVSCAREPATNKLTFEVQRPMQAVTHQNRAISPGAQPVMYAYGLAKSVAYHSANRATKRVILVRKDGSYPPPDRALLPDDIVKSFTIQADKYLVPSTRTTYVCTSRKMNLTKGETLYMVAATNIVEEKAHHFIVYGCEDNAFTRSYMKTQACYTDRGGGANDPRSKCSLWHVWAAGKGPFILPKDVGLRMSEKSTMIMMETHYDNPNFSRDTRDSSGVTLHFSKNRKFEAGTLQLGDARVSMQGNAVQNDFNYTSTCPGACTSTWATDKINVFAGLSHMHTTGKYMWTNRYDAKGNFVETLTSVGFWSNGHQAGIDYSPPLEVRKGDTLSTTCNYDVTKLPKTKFGIETQDEMCIDFLWYYPVQRRSATTSNNFYCGIFQRKFDGKRMNGTVCGDLFDRRNFDFKASNPSFNDTVGISNSFGNPPQSCPTAVPGQKNTTGNGTSNSESVCFPGSARVNTKQRGVVNMANLIINDQVEVGNGKYSSVYMFTHREESKTYEFVELVTEHGAQLRLTAGHFVYAGGVLKRADEVRVGEHLLDRYNKPTRVVSAGLAVDKGLYNPQTMHGDIVVEGVLASTYTQTLDKYTAHAMLAPLRAIHEWLGFGCSVFEKDHYSAMRLFQGVRRRAFASVWA